jgi:glutamyl-tRNA synthetase
LAQYLLAALREHNIECSEEKAVLIAGVMKERVTFPQDFWREAQYFFEAPTTYDEQVIAKKWNAPTAAALTEFARELPAHTNVSPDGIRALLTQVLESQGIKIGQVLQALRVVVTGVSAGPDLMATMSIIGPTETAQRIETAVQKLPQ